MIAFSGSGPSLGREVCRRKLEAAGGERHEAIELLDELCRVHGQHSTYGRPGSDGLLQRSSGVVALVPPAARLWIHSWSGAGDWKPGRALLGDLSATEIASLSKVLRKMLAALEPGEIS